MTTRLGFVHTGPQQHGVNRFGRVLHAATAEMVHTVDCTPAQLLGVERATSSAAASAANLWIVQFTDHLFAPEPERAASVFADLCDVLRPSTVAVVLHDLPGRDLRDDRRRRAYADVARTADVIVVCSRHEADRLRTCGYLGSVTVIPHFVERRPVSQRLLRVERPTVGVLGFVYPGKGHADVLGACALLDGAVSFVAMGGPSPGHDVLIDEIVDLAAELHIGCMVTGWLEEAALNRLVADVDVPVAAHHDVSASGSVATWLGAGRRPIVRASAYTCELLELAPDAVTTYDGNDRRSLVDCLRHAVDDPASTYHNGLPDVLSPRACATAYIGLAGG